MTAEVYYCRKCAEYLYVEDKMVWIEHVRGMHGLMMSAREEAIDAVQEKQKIEGTESRSEDSV